MHLLHNTIRNYAWGSTTLMSDYLGHDASGKPEAEMWLGAHPGAPSLAMSEHQPVCLDELVSADPGGVLGTVSRQAFGERLPFLMKVLAAASPLSLQVHPTRDQAAIGFDDEDARGIPLTAPHRNYKDSNHKPEMIVALTDFAALCGFRPPAEAAKIFGLLASTLAQAQTPATALLTEMHHTLTESAKPAEESIRAGFTRMISGGPAVKDTVDAVSKLLDEKIPETPFRAELETVLELSRAYPGDPGVLISLMLNRVSLSPGEAVFLPAGNVHAYLHGLGIEVMASSDNVLRGGLTSKHIDTEELLRTIDFRPLPVPLIASSTPESGKQVWEPPFDEFQLQRIEIAPGGQPIGLLPQAPAIVLVVQGEGILTSGSQSLSLSRGQSAFVAADDPQVSLHPGDGEAVTAFITTLANTVAASPVSAPQDSRPHHLFPGAP